MWSQARYRLASRFAITSTGFGVGASLLFLHQADRVHANASIVPPVLQPGDDVILTVEQGRAEIAKLRTQLLAQKEQHKKQMREVSNCFFKRDRGSKVLVTYLSKNVLACVLWLAFGERRKRAL